MTRQPRCLATDLSRGEGPASTTTSVSRPGARPLSSVRTMALVVREMELAEVDLIIDYFHSATSEHLEIIGIDPTRLPSPDRWRERYAGDYARPHVEPRSAPSSECGCYSRNLSNNHSGLQNR